MQPKLNFRGFNLAELMVTVAVVGLLTAIALPEYGKMASRARSSGTMNLMLGVRAVIMGQRPIENKTTYEMSTLTCLYASQGLSAMQDLSTAQPAWSAAIAHDWGVFGYASQPYDLWRRPLVADANELEYGPSDCRHDAIWSAGENGVWEGPGTTGDQAAGDDLVVAIPFFKQTQAQCGARFF